MTDSGHADLAPRAAVNLGVLLNGAGDQEGPPPGRVPARPGHLAEHPVEPARGAGPARGRAGRRHRGRRHPPGAGCQVARCLHIHGGAGALVNASRPPPSLGLWALSVPAGAAGGRGVLAGRWECSRRGGQLWPNLTRLPLLLPDTRAQPVYRYRAPWCGPASRSDSAHAARRTNLTVPWAEVCAIPVPSELHQRRKAARRLYCTPI